MQNIKSFTLGEVLGGEVLGLPSDNENSNLIINSIFSDSRKVEKGGLFFALVGTLANGAAFAKMAEEKGAVAIVSESAIEGLNIPNIIVKDARAALSKAAKVLYPKQPETVIAITGTNGKSSTVDFLRQIWAFIGHEAASLGTLGAVTPKGAVNLGFTTPDPISLHITLERLADDGITHLAMESSSHALDQKRMHGVTLSAAGFSNLTQDHLDYHHTMEEYATAKAILFKDLLPEYKPAIINADSDFAHKFEEVAKAKHQDIKTIGFNGAFLKILKVTPNPTSLHIEYLFEGKTINVDLPMVGDFQVLNATMAAAIAISLGDKAEDVFKALENLKPVKGRMEHVGETKDDAQVFVDYAHTPDGLDTLLHAVRPHATGRVILVFGCGGDRDKGKRPKMGAIGAKGADIVIVTDDNPRTENAKEIRREILVAAPLATEIADRKEAIIKALELSQKGDAVIIAGKGHETGQIVGKEILPFSDQETVIEYLKNNGGKIV